jgi:hypothetical protein
MLYCPIPTLLSRDPFDSDTQAFLDRMAKMLQRCVDFGTNLVTWLNPPQVGYTGTVAISLLLHVLEYVDGISILVPNAASGAMIPIARSEMEAVLSLLYLLEKDSERRAIAYHVSFVHERIKKHERLDPTTETGKQFAAIVSKDPAVEVTKWQSVDASEPVKNLKSLLSEPGFSQVDAEWQRTKKVGSGRGRIQWYSLFGWPRNIQGLAEHLEAYSWYHILYNQYSEHAHSSGTLGKIRQKVDGRSVFCPVRYPVGIDRDAPLVAVMACQCYQTLVEKLVPSRVREYQHWYKQEMEQDLMSTSGEILVDHSIRQQPLKIRA